MSPEVGCSKPPIIRRVVVLPQPDGPRRLKNSPSWTSRLMWSTADRLAERLDHIHEPDVDGRHVRRYSCAVGMPGARLGARDGAGRAARLGCGRGYGRARTGVKDDETRADAACDVVRDSTAIQRRSATDSASRRERRSAGGAPSGRRRRYDIDAIRGHEHAPTVEPRREGTRPPMPSLTHDAVIDALRTVQEPELGRDLVTLNMVKDVVIDGSDVAFTIELTTPACPLKDEIERQRPRGARRDRRDAGRHHLGRDGPPRAAAPGRAALPGVKNIIAVASGKGGVGKSTVSVNLAVALAQAGASVGLLDADITGPNIPLMLGLEGQPKASANNKITPLERYGVKAISIQFFVPEGQPIVWRGPLVGGAIQQFLRDVDWGELDYLVIDLPPGTSDAQLTLAQAVPDLRRGPGDDAPGGRARRRRQGAGDVPADERAGHRPRREHDRVRLPALRRADRDLRPRRRRALRGGARASSTSAASRSTSRSARAATSASRRSPSASRVRRRGR